MLSSEGGGGAWRTRGPRSGDLIPQLSGLVTLGTRN